MPMGGDPFKRVHRRADIGLDHRHTFAAALAVELMKVIRRMKTWKC